MSEKLFHQDVVFGPAMERASVPSKILDDLEPLPDVADFKAGYRAAGIRSIYVLNSVLSWIASAKNPQIALFQVAYAMGSGITGGAPMEVVASRLGCTRQAISKGARSFCRATGIEPTGSLKKSVDGYRRARRQAIVRANAAPLVAGTGKCKQKPSKERS